MQTVKTVLEEEEWENLFGDSMQITRFNEFSCESSNEDGISISNTNERQTWAKALNATVIVIECYFLSKPVN